MTQLIEHLGRWWTYQRERFPLHAHAPIVAAFSTAAVGYSALLRDEASDLSWTASAAAFAGALLFFFLLRVADEFKDYEQDRRYRSHRPVPRGLVSLRELGVAGGLAAAIQLIVTLAARPLLLVPLLVVWTYFGLMTAEFFAPDWLRRRPAVYLLSHGLVVPLLALYLTCFDWLTAGAAWPQGLGWLLASSFFGALTFEVGRKLRAPADEAPGVETYTAAWGRRTAVVVWLAAASLAGASTAVAAARIGWLLPAVVVLGLLLAVAVGAAAAFLHRPHAARARLFEPVTGLWMIAQYVMLGLVPLLA